MFLRSVKSVAMVVVVMGMFAGSARAAVVYDFHGLLIHVEAFAGEGDNEAALVLDFGSGNNFAFIYRWQDGATLDRPGDSTFVTNNPQVGGDMSEAMLLALHEAGAITLNYSYHDLFGFGVEGLAYQGHQIVADPFWDPLFPAFYISGHDAYTTWDGVEVPAMAPDGLTWKLSGDFGAGSRQLADGYYDGWTQGNDWQSDPPVTPVIPEPTTLGLLAIGTVALLRRRRAQA